MTLTRFLLGSADRVCEHPFMGKPKWFFLVLVMGAIFIVYIMQHLGKEPTTKILPNLDHRYAPRRTAGGSTVVPFIHVDTDDSYHDTRLVPTSKAIAEEKQQKGSQLSKNDNELGMVGDSIEDGDLQDENEKEHVRSKETSSVYKQSANSKHNNTVVRKSDYFTLGNSKQVVSHKHFNKFHKAGTNLNSRNVKDNKIIYGRKGTHKVKYITLSPAKANDPWLGLNATQVHLRYPDILLDMDYKLHPFIEMSDADALGMENNPRSVADMTDSQAEARFYQLIEMTHIVCAETRRMGNAGDGGWDVCVADPYQPQPGSFVYSFGINHDFTFDDAISKAFECQVHSFDPSMNIGDHTHSKGVEFYSLGLGPTNTITRQGWKVQTLRKIMKRLSHEDEIIDFLKLDIEYNEWSCLRQMIQDSALTNIRQLAMEVHTPELHTVARSATREDLHNMYEILLALEKIGFRRYRVHANNQGRYLSTRTGKPQTCCYEMYFLNINFLR